MNDWTTNGKEEPGHFMAICYLHGEENNSGEWDMKGGGDLN